MINIVLFGPPGSGKGTQAQNLIQKFNLKQISTGDLFRFNMKNETELGKLAKTYIDKGELVPDQVTIDMLIDELKKPTETNGFILDGFPRTSFQTEALDQQQREDEAYSKRIEQQQAIIQEAINGGLTELELMDKRHAEKMNKLLALS